MRDIIKVVFAVVLITLFSGCKKSDKNGMDKPVVQVNQQMLTLGQLCAAIPDNLTKDDSTLFANDFQTRWVKSKLLLQRAELNLTPEEKDVDDLLAEYRSSLLTYKYQQKMVEQKYSSEISDSEIQSYYSTTADNYRLWEPIVKGGFIKILKTAPNLILIESQIRSFKSSDITQLEGYCFQYAKSYLFFPDEWKTLSSITDQFPTAIPDIETIIKRDRYYTTTDATYRYYFVAREVLWNGELAPIESVKERIRAILANKKRFDFIKKMENDLYEDGIITGAVKFYK